MTRPFLVLLLCLSAFVAEARAFRTYDANGNTLTAPGFGMAQPDRYDFENRLIERTIAGKTVTITYDGDGNRARKTVTTATNTVTTLYLVDTVNPTGYAQILEEHVSQNSSTPSLQRVYTFGLTLLAQDQLLNGAWTVRYHGLDGHGSTRYLTDAAGDITDTYDYDAFGNLIAATGNTPNNFLFTSEQLDPDLGLYFLRARYQDTTTGRFWTMDEFEGNQSDPLSLHKYTFNHSEPVNRIDPSGLLSLSEIQVAFGINTMNAIRRAINIYRAYNRASSIIDFINSVQGVANLMASGGLSEIEATFREISTTSLGRRYRFSANMVVESLERNSRQVIQTAITDWSLGLFKAFQRGARINRFVVYLPLPPFKAGIPGFTLPTGIKVGDYPLALRFGGPRRASGRLLGVGIELRRGSGPDLRQVFRMDYHKPNPGHPNTRELGYWEDPPFHYHINKFDRSQEN